MREGFNKMKSKAQRKEKKRKSKERQDDTQLEKIRDALFQFFHENHKKFYQSNKEYIDNAHLNLPELRVKMESAQDLIDADDDNTQHGNFASWNLLVNITPRGDQFRGINGTGLITFGEF